MNTGVTDYHHVFRSELINSRMIIGGNSYPKIKRPINVIIAPLYAFL